MNFAHEYYANYGGLAVAEYVELYIRSSREEMDRTIATLDLLPHGTSSVLDVGAGHGIFLEELQKRKKIIGVGLEIADVKIEYGRSIGVDMRKGDASNLDFPDKSFDVVVACEVIEHLPYGVYEAALAEFARVARKFVILTVPYDEQRVFVRCPYCRSISNPSYHMRSFNETSLKEVIPNAKLIKTVKLGKSQKFPFERYWKSFPRHNWPQFMVCPACGYRKGVSDGKKEAELPSKDTTLRKLAKGFLLMTGFQKAQWIAGVYEIV